MDSNSGAQKEGTELVRKSFLTEITGTVLILIGLLALLGVISFQEPAREAPIENIVGSFGHHGARILLSVFGNAAYLLGPYLIVTGLVYLKRGRVEEPLLRAVAAVVLLIAFAVVFFLLQGVDPQNFASGGGVVGRRFGHGLATSFGFYGALILAVGTLGAGALLATRLPATEFLTRFQDLFERQTLVVRRPRAPSPTPAASPQASAPQAMPGAAQIADPGPAAAPRSEAVKPNEAPPIVGVEHTNDQARPWFTKVAMPDARGSALGAVASAGTDARSDETPSADSAETLPARPPFIRRFDPAPRTASLTSMLRELAKRGDGTADADQGDGSVLVGAFTADGRRFRFREHHAVPSPSSARFQDSAGIHPHPRGDLQRSFAANTNPDERATRSDGPLLRPVRIRVSDTTFATTGQNRHASGIARAAAALELPSAEPRSAHARATLTEQTSRAGTEARSGAEADEYADEAASYATAVAIPEIEAIDPDGGDLDALDSSVDDEQALMDGEDDAGVANGADDLDGDNAHVDDTDDEQVSEVVDEDISSGASGASVAGVAATLRESISEARAQSVVPESGVPPFRMKRGRYHIPTEILNPPFPVSKADTAAEMELTRQRLEQVMRDYGIQGKVVRDQRGPIVTLFEVKLEPGVKVSRILGISDEIKMNLEAASVRILAPMPGRSTIGIEIPNRSRETVVLGDVIRRDENFFSGRRELTIVLGKDIAGHNQYVDLTTLPHLLMAGATGSGKSVYMNSVIASLLYTRSPEDVRFIMIDPKMVELTLFEGIPHLLMPVITDVRMASKALSWVVGEMERRYAMLSALRCRDLRSYNERAAERGDLNRLPYLVVLIDELSDLMMVAAKDVEDSIIRLTQKARAVGIHVIMATQRPSVDVITALIKANCPARIAFQVAQRTDSRTILDANGAEALVGRGDMLYKSPSASGLRRVQALLITEDEIERIVAEARRYGEPEYVELPGDSDDRRDSDSFENDADEELFDEAWAVVEESGKTSTSYIQRRLRIGYNRAARLIEMMEERGYLGPAIGTRPRELLKKA